MTIVDIKFLGVNLFDSNNFFEFALRVIFNFIVVFIIVKYIYFPKRKREDYFFTFLMISTTIFVLVYLLENVKLKLGFALGLFAVFGIIRYRTSQIPIKDMTYLFIVIGITIINSLSNKKISYSELLLANLVVMGVLYLLENILFARSETRKTVVYEKIELIKPENRKLLIEDIEKRTGLKINRIEVGRIDFMRDTARIRIYYYDDENVFNYMNIENSYTMNNDDD